MVFSIFDIVLVVIVSQGLFLALVLQLIPHKNKSANRILTLILLIASVMCLGRVLVYKYHSLSVIRIGTLVDGTIYLFGPLLYLYFRRLLFKDKQIFKLHFKHYAVLIVFAVYAIWTFTLNKNGFQKYYENGILQKLYFIIELSGLISMLFYTYKLTELSRNYHKLEASQIAYNQNIFTYINSIIITLSLFISIWIFSFIAFYFFSYRHQFFNYNAMWISTAFFMYFIGFYSLTQPKIFRIPTKSTSPKPKKKRLGQEEVERLKHILNKAMTEENLYLKPDLSLSILAQYANTSSNNLSWYLNTVVEKTFYDYINTYRINAFIDKVENNEHKNKTLLAMAFDVGFNAKSTFNKSFKSILNDTPANYIKGASKIRPKMYS